MVVSQLCLVAELQFSATGLKNQLKMIFKSKYYQKLPFHNRPPFARLNVPTVLAWLVLSTFV